MAITEKLPHWDMNVIYPGLQSATFETGFAAGKQAVEELEQLFDREQVHYQEAAPTVDDVLVERFERVITRYNAVLEQMETLGTYITCLVDVNSEDTLAQAKLSELQQSYVQLSQLEKRFTAWLGSLDIASLITASQVAREHEYYLHQAQIQAKYLMSPEEEALASELHVSGGTAWAKLHSNVTSQTKLTLDVDGAKNEYTLIEIRNFAYVEDRKLRRLAQEAEIGAWEKVSVPLAAALNSIKKETLTLTQKRGWQSPLDYTLFLNSIDQKTLNAMMTASRAAFPDLRRYLKTRQSLLGVEKLAWYDLFAPLGKDERVWEYSEATAFIVEQFGRYSQRLADFAAQAFKNNWIDAESRPGKLGGAYCAAIRKGESRILSNFTPSFDGISTLAHELGHAYHNLNLKDLTALQSVLPMTLAETASVFCETIVRQAAMEKASQSEKIAIVGSYLQSASQIVVDITSRFLFEEGVFEKRKQRELSVKELKELMLETQRQTYGDVLDESTLHPYMWAVKGHYYSVEWPYYNYPYMFGLLFGLGLYARYQQDPEAFKVNYDSLLASTGLADASTLAQRFGIDLRTEAFWQSSLDILRQDIDQFEQLARNIG